MGKGQGRGASHLKTELSGFLDLKAKWEYGAVVTVRRSSPGTPIFVFPLASCKVTASHWPSGTLTPVEWGAPTLQGLEPLSTEVLLDARQASLQKFPH